MATQKNTVNPLSHNVPIVNKDGTPTPEFMKKWSQQANTNANIPVALSTAAQVSAVLDLLGLDEGDILFRGPTEWAVLGPGTAGYLLKSGGVAAAPAWESISAALDVLGNTKGDILFNDGTNWNVLHVPATDGWVLTFDHTSGLPVWKAGGGGGGVTIGAGAPTALAAAGTPYSRSDQAGLYVSTPTTSGGAVVQAFTTIQGNNVPGSITIGSTPTVGNLIIAYVCWGNVQVAPTINLTDWTVIDIAPDPSGGSNIAGFGLYRYVQPGDTATLPAICTAGNSYWAGQFWEIGGVSGVFATDVPVHTTHQAFGNTHTAGPITTTAAGQIVLLCGGQYDASLNPVTNSTAGWTQDSAAANAGNFGNMTGWHQNVSGSGTAVSAALASNAGSPYCFSGLLLAITVATTTAPGWTLVGPAGAGTKFDLTKAGNVAFMTGDDPTWEASAGSNVTWAQMLAKPGVAAATQKLYFELFCGTTGNYTVPGLVPTTAALDFYPGQNDGWGVDSAGNPHSAGGGSSSGSFGGITGGDTYGFAVDFGAGTIQTYKNNVAQGSFSGISFGTNSYVPAIGSNGTPQRYQLRCNAGNQKYAAPSGFTPWG